MLRMPIECFKWEPQKGVYKDGTSGVMEKQGKLKTTTTKMIKALQNQNFSCQTFFDLVSFYFSSQLITHNVLRAGARSPVLSRSFGSARQYCLHAVMKIKT